MNNTAQTTPIFKEGDKVLEFNNGIWIGPKIIIYAKWYEYGELHLTNNPLIKNPAGWFYGVGLDRVDEMSLKHYKDKEDEIENIKEECHV